MSSYTTGSTFGTVVKWLILGFLALIAIKVGLALLGAVVGLAFTLIFTLGPIVLIGWLVLKALRWMSRPEPTY